jgi:hypothetical protein
MKLRLIDLIVFIVFVFVFASCTEIVDVNINTVEQQIVVEANIGLDERAAVHLSRTIKIDNTGVFPGVRAAKIKITDSRGNSEILTESESLYPGNYTSMNMKGRKGETYRLEILVDNKTISSLSSIPTSVPIDSFKVSKSIYPGGGPSTSPTVPADFFEIKIKFTDPPQEKNYYHILLYVNDVPQSGNYIYDDRLTNGSQMEGFLLIYNPLMKSGDKIQVEMRCVDKSVYDYFSSLKSSGGPGGGSSPSNPITNLNGSLLGYFSAHTVERKVFVVE